MQIDDFLGLVKKRRSIRRFKPDPIPDEYVGKIIEAARWAMSGANAQPWEFIIIKDQKTKDKIAELHQSRRKEHFSLEKTRIEELRHHQLSRLPTELPGFKDAPVLIAVCGDRRTWQGTTLAGIIIGGDGGPGAVYLKNIANATYSLHLAAAALGLGAQWVSVSRSWEQSLKTLLGVPELLEVHTIVPIGYPAYESPLTYRRELKEIMHFETYDQSRYRSGDDVVQFLYDLRKRTKSAYAKEKPSE